MTSDIKDFKLYDQEILFYMKLFNATSLNMTKTCSINECTQSLMKINILLIELLYFLSCETES